MSGVSCVREPIQATQSVWCLVFCLVHFGGTHECSPVLDGILAGKNKGMGWSTVRRKKVTTASGQGGKHVLNMDFYLFGILEIKKGNKSLSLN